MRNFGVLGTGSSATSSAWELDLSANSDAQPSARDPSSAALGPSKSATNQSQRGAQGKHAGSDGVIRSFNTWAFKREQPADPHLMSQTVSGAISRGEPVSFVLYWGKGPRCRPAEPELQCLDYLAAMAGRVREAYAPGAAIKLIFTDTHAELNGHSRDCIRAYFARVGMAAADRGFGWCRLSELTAKAKMIASDPDDEVAPEDTLLRLSNSARKWYRGGGTAEEGALNYYQMNMIEKRTVELAFPRSIFVTFSGSELRSLFPKGLPIFYMYSVRRGISSKPWFLPSETTPCDMNPCQCAAFQG
jgi:L-tyrosine isonitrile synthase